MKYRRLSERLASDPSGFAAAWSETFRRCPLRLPAETVGDGIEYWLAPMVEDLTDAFAPKPRHDGRRAGPVETLAPGAPELREIEKSAAFLGARLAVESATGFDVAAVFTSLRELLIEHTEETERSEIYSFCEWLSVMAIDSMAAARERSQAERMCEEIEGGSPVVSLAPDIVGVFLIASPTREVVEHVLARALLRMARTGAVAAIIDVTGVASSAAEAVIEGLAPFVNHRKIADRIPVFLAGADPSELWENVAAMGGRIHRSDSFEDACTAAFEHSGFRVVRRAADGG